MKSCFDSANLKLGAFIGVAMGGCAPQQGVMVSRGWGPGPYPGSSELADLLWPIYVELSVGYRISYLHTSLSNALGNLLLLIN